MSGGYRVEKEIEELVHGIKRIAGDSNKVTFGQLFKDDKLQNTLESLFGTLKAARKREVINFKGELLLQGVHDKEEITLLKPDYTAE
ncbi:hypothetical protein AKO1_014748 [Acrasis kona]|uniref:Costars domain-containing protein n=1 Tax=Acrasis kona TaxID=1008807 RepID=A0AAW2Z0Z9_9EUKA